MNHLANTFTAFKGEKLFYQYWEESSKSYNKIIILIHGICYHSGSYPYLIPGLIAQGYKVYAYDLRGFGRSPGERGDIEDFNTYVDDLESFRRFIKQKEGFREILFLGHSLGAVAALAYPLRYPENEIRTILASAMFSSPMIDKAVKKNSPFDVTLKDFATDKSRTNMLYDDPYVVKQITYNLLQQVKDMFEKVKNNIEKLKDQKYLFLHGEFDKVALPSAVNEFCEMLECKRKKIVTYPRMLHDIFAEKRREQVFDEIKLWLSETDFEHKAP